MIHSYGCEPVRTTAFVRRFGVFGHTDRVIGDHDVFADRAANTSDVSPVFRPRSQAGALSGGYQKAFFITDVWDHMALRPRAIRFLP